jgi:hypothetical protein
MLERHSQSSQIFRIFVLTYAAAYNEVKFSSSTSCLLNTYAFDTRLEVVFSHMKEGLLF